MTTEITTTKEESGVVIRVTGDSLGELTFPTEKEQLRCGYWVTCSDGTALGVWERDSRIRIMTIDCGKLFKYHDNGYEKGSDTLAGNHEKVVFDDGLKAVSVRPASPWISH